LDSIILPIGYVKPTGIVGGDHVGRMKFSRGGSTVPPLFHEGSVGAALDDPRIAIAIGDEKVSRGNGADVGGLGKPSLVAAGFAVNSEREEKRTFRGELHQQMPPDIGNPDVVPRIHVQTMQPAPRRDRYRHRAPQIISRRRTVVLGSDLVTEASIGMKTKQRVLTAVRCVDPPARVDRYADHAIKDPTVRKPGPALDRLER